MQDLWSSTLPGIPVDKDALKSGGPMSLIARDRIKMRPSPSSEPAGSMIPPLSYSAAVAFSLCNFST